jgi:DNA repair protein RadC
MSFVGPSQQVLQVLHDSDANAIERLQRISVKELVRIPGIGPAKATIVVAAVEFEKHTRRGKLPEFGQTTLLWQEETQEAWGS